MKKVKKSAIICTCLMVFITQVFMGCMEYKNKDYASKDFSTSKVLRTEREEYIAENYDQYKDMITERTGLENSIVEEEDDGELSRYFQFIIDDKSKIKIAIGKGGIYAIKKVGPLYKEDTERELTISFSDIGKESEILKLTLIGSGIVSCRYNRRDLENVIPDQKVMEERTDLQIRKYISNEELEELISKTHQIYDLFKEIADEHNKNIEGL